MEPSILGLVLDSSIIIDAERKRQTVEDFLTSIRNTFGEIDVSISAITILELVHGVARANTPENRDRRRAFIDELKRNVPVHPVANLSDKYRRIYGRPQISGGFPGSDDYLGMLNMVRAGLQDT